MKQNNRAKLLFAFLGIATFASLIGTVSGSLAWYAYSSRATLSYSGTSVNNTVQLQIGIASPEEVKSLETIREELALDNALDDEEKQRIEASFVEFWDIMEPIKWDDDDSYYYFAPIGTDLNSAIINAYLKSSGYATNSLVPVTSGSFSRGDVFELENSPKPYTRSNTTANQLFYSKIPFAFRVIESNTIVSNKFKNDVELWLSDATVRASNGTGDGEIYKAVRMFIDRDNTFKKNPTDEKPYFEDDFIVNPSATTKGSTTVGGLLDLSRDKYYDYDSDGNEFMYGEYEKIDDGGIKPTYAGVDEIADINGTHKTEEDTFTAKHRPGINYYDNYDKYALKTAEYECVHDAVHEENGISPKHDDISGDLSNRIPNKPSSLCFTTGTHYIGRVDFTIYLEGWDHSVVDEELEHYFDLGLTFEINKL